MAGNAPEFSKGFARVTKSMKKLFEACLMTSTYENDDGAIDAARAAVEKQWAQFASRFAPHPEFEQARRQVAQVHARLGDDFFYDWGNCRQAINEYEASLALDPDCMDALGGIVAVYLQGTDIDPEAALPYAIRRAELNPAKEIDVEYIRRLLSQK